MLFNETTQYNIHIFNKTIFVKYRTRQIKATETNKLNTYLNCNGNLNTDKYKNNLSCGGHHNGN